MNVYGRPLWTGSFFATSVQWGAHVAPGNVEVLVACAQQADQATRRPVIASMDDDLGTGAARSAETALDLVAIWYGVGGHNEHDVAVLARARLLADARKVPLLVYFDSPEPISDVVRALVEPDDWIGVCGYPRSASESTDDTLKRVAANLMTAIEIGHPAALIRPLYTRSGEWSVSQVLALQDGLTALVRVDSRIVADLWFSWARTSGALDHPEFRDVAARLADGVQAPTAVPEPAPTPAPNPEPPTPNPDQEGDDMDFTKIRAISKNPILEGLPDIGFEQVDGSNHPDGNGQGAFKSRGNGKYAEDQGGGIAYVVDTIRPGQDWNTRFSPGLTAGTIVSERGNKTRVYLVS